MNSTGEANAASNSTFLLPIDVEESRAQRKERQKARFRDRGGIFVPKARGGLMDILIEKTRNTPVRARSRSTSPVKMAVQQRKAAARKAAKKAKADEEHAIAEAAVLKLHPEKKTRKSKKKDSSLNVETTGILGSDPPRKLNRKKAATSESKPPKPSTTRRKKSDVISDNKSTKKAQRPPESFADSVASAINFLAEGASDIGASKPKSKKTAAKGRPKSSKEKDLQYSAVPQSCEASTSKKVATEKPVIAKKRSKNGIKSAKVPGTNDDIVKKVAVEVEVRKSPMKGTMMQEKAAEEHEVGLDILDDPPRETGKLKRSRAAPPEPPPMDSHSPKKAKTVKAVDELRQPARKKRPRKDQDEDDHVKNTTRQMHPETSSSPEEDEIPPEEPPPKRSKTKVLARETTTKKPGQAIKGKKENFKAVPKRKNKGPPKHVLAIMLQLHEIADDEPDPIDFLS